MLVVDLDTLQTIDVLHLVGDVHRQRLDTLQTQDVMRIGRTIDDQFALVHHLAVVHQHVLVLGNQVFVRYAIKIGDDQTLLALGVLAEGNRTGVLGEHAGILGRAGFEQFGNARQTAGDVTGLGRFLRQTGEHVTDRNLLSVEHGDDRADLEGDGHCLFATMHAHFFAVGVEEPHLRPQALGLRLAAAFRIDHHQR